MRSALLFIAICTLLLGQAANAARIDVFFDEVGADVFARFEGSVELGDLNLLSAGSATPLIGKVSLQFGVQQGFAFEAADALTVDFWQGNAPIANTLANTPLGDEFAVNFFAGGSDVFYFLGRDYVSGDRIAGEMQFTNHTIASLGLTPGFLFSQITANNALAITVGPTSAVPVPAALPLFLTALIALGGWVRFGHRGRRA